MRARVIVSLVACLFLSACGPWGPQGVFVGGPFLGSSEPRTPPDWSFTDDYKLVAIETRGPFFRHSVTILCVSADGALYVMARHAEGKRWVQNVLSDPRVRLSISDRIYDGQAVRVDEARDGAKVARAFLRKYVGLDAPHARSLGGAPAPGDDRADIWTFRIDPPVLWP